MRSFQQGATLVELVITIVIISVAVAGVVGAFGVIAGRSADPLNQTRAVELAQLYMDEILSKRYDENTPLGGQPRYSGACNIGTDGSETRSTFDDVDDYHNLTDSPPRRAEAGTAGDIAGYTGFSVSVTVTCAGDDANIGLNNEDAKRIDISVTGPGVGDFVFTAYRANF